MQPMQDGKEMFFPNLREVSTFFFFTKIILTRLVKSWRIKKLMSKLKLFHEIVLVSQSCPTHCDCMDYSPPGFSVPGILQKRILE